MATTRWVALALLLAAGPAGAVFEVTVTDGTIASLGTATPSPGNEVNQFSLTDKLSFANGVSLERALWTHTVAATFTDDQDGSTSSTTVAFQGASATLTDLVFGAQAAAGPFAPFRVRTASDLTGEGGWTQNSSCGTVTYQGSLSVPSYTSAGTAVAATTYYYQVCDAAAEVYVGATKDLTVGDFAYVSSTPTLVTTTSTDYEVVLLGLAYVFTSAGSATTVTLDQGRYVPLTATTVDVYLLLRYPDGFPAGSMAATVTTTGVDITI